MSNAAKNETGRVRRATGFGNRSSRRGREDSPRQISRQVIRIAHRVVRTAPRGRLDELISEPLIHVQEREARQRRRIAATLRGRP